MGSGERGRGELNLIQHGWSLSTADDWVTEEALAQSCLDDEEGVFVMD